MMKSELITVLEHIEREKGISREVLFAAVESALVSAARKIVGKKSEEEISVKIDKSTGKIQVFSDGKEIKSEEFGRIAAQTAKQVMIQKIREAERDVIFEEYQKRIGGIISGNVHRFDRGTIIVDFGKAEGIIPRSQQSRKESYRQGEPIRAYLMDVKKTPRGPQIVLSRTNAGLVKKMFEMEVPEIYEGIVEIKAIYREAGERTKIAVLSKDEKVDPVGACVGMRGQRVKNIVRELHGERIDIVRWSPDIKEYIKAALSPAEVATVNVNKEKNNLEVIVNDDQLSLAIGKHGQNVRIASKLVGWDVDVRGKSQKEEEKEKKPKKKEKAAKKATKKAAKKEVEKETKKETKKKIKTPKAPSLSKLEGVGKKTYQTLKDNGIDSIEKLKELSLKELLKLPGIGKKTAEKILKSAQEG